MIELSFLYNKLQVLAGKSKTLDMPEIDVCKALQCHSAHIIQLQKKGLIRYKAYSPTTKEVNSLHLNIHIL